MIASAETQRRRRWRGAICLGPAHRFTAAVTLLVALAIVAAAARAEALLTAVEGTPPAPEFALPDLDGRTVRLADLRGKVVVINFWATWCAPCREEMPSMHRLWQQLRANSFELAAINVGETPEQVRSFLSALDHPIGFPIVLDEEGTTVRDFSVKGFPTTFVIDKSGRLVFEAVGRRDWESPEIVETLKGLTFD